MKQKHRWPGSEDPWRVMGAAPVHINPSCQACGRTYDDADEECPLWKMRLPRQKEDREP